MDTDCVLNYIGDKKENNIKEGKGIYYWNDGDRYEGEWKNDKKDGLGIYYYKNKWKYIFVFCLLKIFHEILIHQVIL